MELNWIINKDKPISQQIVSLKSSIKSALWMVRVSVPCLAWCDKGQAPHSAPVHLLWRAPLVLYSKVISSNLTEWIAAMRCRWMADLLILDSRHCSALWHAVTYLQMSTRTLLPHCNPSLSAHSPPCSLSHWGISVSVSGCADADPPLLEARRELMVIALLPPAPTRERMTFCGGLGPLLSEHRWPLTLHPFLHRTAAFSEVARSVIHPQTHFQTKTLVWWQSRPSPSVYISLPLSLQALCGR